MDDSSQGIERADVLGVFDELDDPGEPTTASEVADALGVGRRMTVSKLEELAEAGAVRSKRMGPGTRAWWRQHPDSGRDAEGSPADVGTTPTHGEGAGTVIERILEASPVSIVLVEPSGEISFANERAEQTLGLERDEITSRTYRQPEWNIYYGDGTPVTEEEHPVTRVLETKEPDYGFEHWIELPDGTERWLSSNSAPVTNADGEVEYVVVGFEDATRLKEREDKLTSDKRRLLALYSEELFRPFIDETDGEVRVDVDEVVRLPDGTVLQYVSATGMPARDLVGVFERHFGVDDVRLLRSTDDQCRLEVRVQSPTVSLVFSDLGGQVRTLVWSSADDPPVLVGEVPGDVEPRTVIQSVREVYPDARLEAQKLRYSPRLLYDIVEDALTERQFAVLQSAYYGGYFASPRASTGDELAERLGITRQTFNQHLRKAEETVFERLFEASGKDAR